MGVSVVGLWGVSSRVLNASFRRPPLLAGFLVVDLQETLDKVPEDGLNR